MIITRTPFRISFFGGGTDYPQWYCENGGSVLSTTINKYCYISCRKLPPFFEHNYRLVYSKIENVKSCSEIEHPAVRAIFEWANVDKKNGGLEVHHDGDLPARSGLGSSSSFTVGLIHALSALNGEIISKKQLAEQAIYVEQEVIKEHVGSQDQVAAAFGGFNLINFNANDFSVSPLVLKRDRKKELNNHLLLFFTGLSRIASEVAKSKIDNMKNRSDELNKIHATVEQAQEILCSDTPIEEFGRLLDQSWQYKKRLSDRVSTKEIDEMYDIAKNAGAVGGKLLGAGGGGFLLIFAKPAYHDEIKKKFSSLVHVPFQFENEGSKLALYQPDGF